MSIRIEEKHVAKSGISYPKALHNLKLNGNIKRHHPPRTVASIYYDTPDFSLAFASLRGDAQRQKVRARTYFSGNPSHLDFINAKYFLELKLKDARIGDKKRLHELNWNQIFDPIDIKFDSKRMYGLRPNCCVVYSREYFIELITGTRITIDNNLRVYRLTRNTNKLVDIANGNNLMVVEVKRSVGAYRQPLGLSSQINFSRNRFSKYLYALHRQQVLEYIY